MTNHPNRSRKAKMTAPQTYRVAGDWMERGQIRGLVPRHIDIAIIDGRAYDDEGLAMLGREDARLAILSDDEMEGWGPGVTFSPDPGELDRVPGLRAALTNLGR
ncbi:hypothetical protein [Acidocella sp.]|jgi:hypothetical protein|uniref:hypothetical protein n=1 Tax=Acidocella sp. TaxID=50710 RepID=UPI002F3EF5D4